MKSDMQRRARFSLLLGFTALLVSCVHENTVTSSPGDAATRALRSNVDTIVIIYAENRAFDNLFGNFPGARGLGEVVDRDGRTLPAYAPQLDRDRSVLATLPPTWGGVTAPGVRPVVTEAQSAGLPNAPFSIERAFTPQSNVVLSTSTVTRDLAHRFFEHQMQIDGGNNDGFAAWSDAGGLAMGHYDYGQSALYSLAKEFVLADNFFQGAFGGSFLNHQYLICACAPVYPDADTAAAKPSIAILDSDAPGHYLPRLKLADGAKLSALDGPPQFARNGNIAPLNYFGDGKFYAVNTMQPAYQPSGNNPAAGDGDNLYADPDNATTLPPQTQATIGDALDARRIGWAWYSGSWDAALADGRRSARKPHEVIYAPAIAGGNPDFQPHHQPFNYYEKFDPKIHGEQRVAHLRDYSALVADAAVGRLPAVTFYKPQGNVNQHAGYASVAEGDAHIADLVAKLRAGPQWAHMVIVITYDEFGGAWDHVAPPQGDLLGPGSRIPALIISPFAKRGTVDHTQYDTESILRLITRRFDLDALPGITVRDQALARHRAPPMGDLTGSLELGR
ncbi:MAG TPA: acid phosphatase [Steroidobacteraceae bacterium]|jgi:acid phosphatase|nr:acid phosphatase [Steroidobacteraceae bacterium]